MNRDQIIRMAREASSNAKDALLENEDDIAILYVDELERFAELIARHILAKGYPELVSLSAKHAAETVATAEREACAKVAEAYEPKCDSCPSGVANAIRARSQ